MEDSDRARAPLLRLLPESSALPLVLLLPPVLSLLLVAASAAALLVGAAAGALALRVVVVVLPLLLLVLLPFLPKAKLARPLIKPPALSLLALLPLPLALVLLGRDACVVLAGREAAGPRLLRSSILYCAFLNMYPVSSTLYMSCCRLSPIVDMVTVKNCGGSVPTMFFTVSCMARTTCRQGGDDGAVKCSVRGDL